jgi:hypothetical protein
MILLLSLIFLTLPALAMMDGSGHMHGEKDTEKPLQKQDKGAEERQTGHRHREYYHSHEGGELPHSHYQEKSAPSEHDQITYEEMPSIASPVPPREMEVHTQQDAPQVPWPNQEQTVYHQLQDFQKTSDLLGANLATQQ